MQNLANHPGNAALYSTQNVRPDRNSRLKGKKAIYLGSSVTLGFGSLGESFAEFLQARDGVEILVKEAVNGTTLVSRDSESYIPRMLTIDQNLKPDVFVCQLSTNDATRDLPLGTVCSSDIPDDEIRQAAIRVADPSDEHSRQTSICFSDAKGMYDLSTIIGAMEFIISYVKAVWKCPVVFYTGTRFASGKYHQMVKALLQLKEKWNITVIDQWNDEDLNDITDAWRNLYMIDPIHPTKAGYQKWWLPQFEAGLIQALYPDEPDEDNLQFNTLIPELTVADIEKTKQFYLEILDFKLEYERPEDRFIFLSKEGSQLMLQEENGVWNVGKMEYPFGRGINFEMTVSDVEGLCQRVVDAGIPLFRDLKVNAYRKDQIDIVQKEFLVQDPDGYLLRFTD